MQAADAVGALAAVALPAVVVLLDVAAYDRPTKPPEPADALPDLADDAPPLTVAPVLGVGRLPAVAPVEEAAHVPPPAAEPEVTEDVADVEPEVEPDVEPVVERVSGESILTGLAARTEADERSALRKVMAAIVLLTCTIAAAAGVAALVYNAVSALG